MNIIVTGIKIGEHEVPVPEGISDLLADTWTSDKKERTKGYSRRIENRDGKIFTILTKKREVK